MTISILIRKKQEAQLSPRDRAMRRVSWNLTNCHATVQKLHVGQVFNKSKLWSWRVTVGRCVINMCTQPWRDRVASFVLSALFCSLAILDTKLGHTMDELLPVISVLCHSDWLFHAESCPRLDVVHPRRAWPSSPTCTWHCSLHYLFLQATPLFPHDVTIVC